MQVLNSSVARPWKLEQNTSGQASRQALRASRLWKLEQNNITKKGPFFGLGEATPRTQNVLAQGQSEAHGDSKLYNTIVGSMDPQQVESGASLKVRF